MPKHIYNVGPDLVCAISLGDAVIQWASQEVTDPPKEVPLADVKRRPPGLLISFSVDGVAYERCQLPPCASVSWRPFRGDAPPRLDHDYANVEVDPVRWAEHAERGFLFAGEW